MKKTLFLPSNNTSFIEMYRLIHLISNNESATPIVLLKDKTVDKSKKSVEDNNIEYIRLFNNHTDVLGKKIEKFKKRLFPSFNRADRKKIDLSNTLANCKKRLNKIVQMLQPVSVVLKGDRHLGKGWEPALIKVCRENQIPTVIVPIAYSGIDSLLIKRRNKDEFDADLYLDFKKRFNTQHFWDHESQKNILYKPKWMIEALAENDMLSKNPWVMGGGYSDLVLVDGEETRRRYIQLGCNADKIIVTGHSAHDSLFEKSVSRQKIRQFLYRKYSLKANRELIIIAFPNFSEEKLMDINEHKKALSQLCNLTQKVDANWLVSLHPSMDPVKYSFIKQKFKIPVAEERLSEILPAATIFSSLYSSTARWALLCQIPVVIYDFYALNFDFFDHFAYINIVKKEDAFINAFERLLTDEDYYGRIKEEEQKSAKDIAPFDGNATQRIVDILIHPKNYVKI